MQPGRPQRGAAPAPGPALSASLAGAVDLSALRARNEARERAEAQAAEQATAPTDDAAGPPAAVTVIDVTEASFQADVLDRSFQVPVVLDLWAEWCGPCKQLSPVLERLAEEGAGSWVLAKIDVDTNQAIAQALRVQGIPAVKAVFQGQVLGEFTGALPEPQVRQFIQAVVEATSGAAPAGPDGAPAELAEPEDPRVTEAEDATARGDFDDAARRYREILAAEPAHPRATDALREVELLRRVTAAPADAVARADAAGGDTPEDIAAQLVAADVLLAEGDVDGAFGRLLGTVRRAAGAERESARTRLVELFAIVGPDDPRVATARRDLSRALY